MIHFIPDKVCLLHGCGSNQIIGYARYEDIKQTFYAPRCQQHWNYYGDEEMLTPDEFEVTIVLEN